MSDRASLPPGQSNLARAVALGAIEERILGSVENIQT